jgi:hypothetical protein
MKKGAPLRQKGKLKIKPAETSITEERPEPEVPVRKDETALSPLQLPGLQAIADQKGAIGFLVIRDIRRKLDGAVIRCSSIDQ